MTTTKQTEQDEARATLLEQFHIVPGDTIWTKLDHVSSSGMTRWIDLYVIRDNEPLRITYSAAVVAGYPYDNKREALKIGGCGMDMGFAAVYSLARRLFPDGHPCNGIDGPAWDGGCTSNDHSNERGPDRKAGYYVGRMHSDPGYALNQRWL